MTTAAIQSNWVGRVIDGRFPLLQWLGGTAWSSVFLSELKGPGSQKAAIKLIPAKGGSEKAYLASWASAVTLSHPHLMRLLDTGRCEIDGTQMLFAVTEYADEVLSEIIPERALKPDEVREMLAPVLDALFYLHGKGYVHGHLKPSNIMAVDNHLKLSVDSLEVAGEPGTHFRALSVYDAPEIADGVLSPAADVWSLGVTLVEALTQHAPVWDRSSGKEPAVPASMPDPFARIARECLRLDPAQRCTLADVNKSRFERVRAAPKAESNDGDAEPAQRSGIKRRVLIAAGAVFLLIVVIVFLQLRPHQAGTEQAAPGTPAAQPEPAAPAMKAQSTKSAPSQTAGTRTSSGTQNGAIATRVLPDVPEKALNTIEGKVRVEIRVAVDASGNVTDASFESAGPSRYFANLAMEAARKWRFQPAILNGRDVSSVWTLRFQFQRTGTEVIPVETAP